MELDGDGDSTGTGAEKLSNEVFLTSSLPRITIS
jgi:hypothetical protein